MRSRLIPFFVFFCALLASGSAAAACAQADLAGQWRFYAVFIEDFTPYWVRCAVKIGTNGAVAAGTVCTNSMSQSTTITSGQLTLSSGCLVTGSIQSTDGPAFIRHGALDAGKTVMSGVGDDNGDDDTVFMFNAVKK